MPALLEWDGPAVASSIKTDLLACTIRRRRELGDVFVFDPFALSADRSHTWSPLAGGRIGAPEDARAEAVVDTSGKTIEQSYTALDKVVARYVNGKASS